MTLHQLLLEFPPCLCRLLARQQGRATTSRALGALARLSRDRVDQVSKLDSWNSVRMGEALRFMKACGVELTSVRRHREFMKRNHWDHLTRSRKKRFYARLMQTFIEQRKQCHQLIREQGRGTEVICGR